MKYIIALLLIHFAVIIELRAEEVSILVDSCRIKGSLEIPVSDKTVDVALIIAGSGPTDRDGNNTIIGKNNSHKMLAELLLQNGLASLRYDKRGIGSSDKVNETGLTFDTYINDAVEWIKFLRKDKRFSKIIIIGHSEGSLIGMIAAKRANADKFISLCGAGKPLYEILDEQVVVKGQLPVELVKQFRTIMDSLKQGSTVNNVNPAFFFFRPSIQPYMISLFKYTPCIEISKLSIPILIIGGTTDFQVGIEDARLLFKSNRTSELAIIENMNHILKEVQSSDRTVNLQSYAKPDLVLSPKLCKTIIEFLNK